MKGKIKFDKSHYHMIVQRSSNEGDRALHDYQKEAIDKLNEVEVKKKKEGFSGLLVLPTGAGKTFTAAWWVLNAYINNGYKVLWIAHRHELLNQAAETFIYSSNVDTMPDREAYTIRIISGVHGRGVSLEHKDDLVIASKDSVNAGFKYYKEQWLKEDNDKLLIVIDEAHHAVARTYRKIIDNLKNEVKTVSVLGLTATPVRTAEKERGYLKVIFPDDIIYKVDMRSLITRGILSEPIFEEVSTKIDMTKNFTESEIRKIIKYDFNRLPVESLNSIAQNAKRNRIIVNTYVNSPDKYRQTIVFALNVSNAIALNKLFNKSGVRSEYIVSGIQDSKTKVIISPEHNARVLEAFRRGEIQVLINVNILTEGTDVPNVQSVFLARPTVSPILIAQMIGRGLRGVRAGGTSQAYIVGFVDDWKGKIRFVSPEKLINNENEYIPDTVTVSTKRVLNAVCIRVLEMFTQAMDHKLGNIDLVKQGIMEHIPVGCYSFDYKLGTKTKKCDVLVYNDVEELFSTFINELEQIGVLYNKKKGIEKIVNAMVSRIAKVTPHLSIEDFIDIYDYYMIKGRKPEFVPFVERNQYDVSQLAQYLYESQLEETKKIKYLKKCWADNKQEYRAFWGSSNFDTFCIAVDYEISRIDNNKRQEKKPPDVTVILPPKEKMDLCELKKHHPSYYEGLREYIYSKYQDEKGYYFSAYEDEEGNRFKSKGRIYFQIDHIIPISEGGLTIKENLQLLSRYENLQKGNKQDTNR